MMFKRIGPKPRIIVAIFVACSFLLGGYIILFADFHYITAFEGKVKADKVAREWSGLAKLNAISSENVRNGKSDCWTYGYYESANSGLGLVSLSCIYIEVKPFSGAKAVRFDHLNISDSEFEGFRELEMDIDSDEAWERAMNYEEFRAFKTYYWEYNWRVPYTYGGNYMVTTTHDWGNMTNEVWKISLERNYGPDEGFANAVVYIQADNLHPIDTEIHWGSKWLMPQAERYCATVNVIIIIAVLLLAWHYRRREMRLPPTPQEFPASQSVDGTNLAQGSQKDKSEQ